MTRSFVAFLSAHLHLHLLYISRVTSPKLHDAATYIHTYVRGDLQTPTHTLLRWSYREPQTSTCQLKTLTSPRSTPRRHRSCRPVPHYHPSLRRPVTSPTHRQHRSPPPPPALQVWVPLPSQTPAPEIHPRASSHALPPAATHPGNQPAVCGVPDAADMSALKAPTSPPRPSPATPSCLSAASPICNTTSRAPAS